VNDQAKTNAELLEENSFLNQRIRELELSDSESKRAEEDLRKSEERYRTILEDIDEGYFEDDLAGNFTFVNDALCRYLGYSREELIGMNYRQYSDEATAKKSYELFYNIYNTEKPIKRFPGQFISKDGTRHFNEVSASLIRDAKGKPIGFRGISQDVTERKRAEEALRESEERYRTLVENASDIVLRTDDTGHFTFVNPAALRIMGYEEKELIGRHYLTLYRPDMREEAMKFFGRQFVKGIPNTYSEYPFIVKDGREIWLGQNIQLIVEDGHVVGFQAMARDITERKRMEAEILALSITDQLTGLHNRRGFLSLAGQQLKLAERNKSGMLLFFVDLDGLKWINDTLGHEEGDKALIETATVFKETFRTSDIIARLGGDEYAALTVDITEAKSELFTARLQSLIDTQNNQKNRRYRLSISVGCSYYDSENPCSLDDLMAHADKLMYEQKQNKKGILLQGASLSSSNPYTSLHDESKDK
jgi:diguanylate cyclase (GGDEF)-like protein/PAS domain S-box-containing protein